MFQQSNLLFFRGIPALLIQIIKMIPIVYQNKLKAILHITMVHADIIIKAAFEA